MNRRFLILLCWMPLVVAQISNTTNTTNTTNATIVTIFPVLSPTTNPLSPIPTNSSTGPPLTSLPPTAAPPTATTLPSLPPVSQSFPVNVTISGITLQLENVPPLIEAEERYSLWENVTRNFFNQFYAQNDVGIRNFTTVISFLSQNSVLRDEVIVTTFNYSQVLTYTSLNGTQTPGYYAVYPLTTVEGNLQYATALNLTFAGWENLKVPIAVPLLPGQTRAPTFAPTEAPTTSLLPTVRNTTAPSVSPTLASSESPSVVLSQAPTALASSEAPSAVPSMVETSLAPSAAATPVEPVEVSLMNIRLPLEGGGVLEDNEIDMWERVTAEWFEGYFVNNGRRRLQASMVSAFTFVRQDEDNAILYNQTMDYAATNDTPDAEVVALLPFNDEAANTEYGELLRTEFANMRDLVLPLEVPSILGPNATPEEGEGGNDDDDSGLSMGVLIGIIVAGAAVLLVCAYVAYSFVQGSGDGSVGVEQRDQRDNQSEVSPQFIISPSEEDLSLMEDPYLPPKQKSFESKILDVGYGDQSVATVDYDYSKLYGGGDTSVVSSAGGTMGDTTRLTAGTLNTAALAALGAESQLRDSGIQEQVIDIIAPAGKLGVVIDTPDDGAPVVHAVKDTSVIADQIQVGDKLVAVDDEDVCSMTAIRVSKLISKKSNNPSRKLTIIRNVPME
ncbi:hypothetical protein FisN_38Lh008 [Fistulifera solaris]|uniref:PDZ domain-containing protein n=1 Tax=Fistulifera solaris TaxID=1519565 RepID=A0A1Z5J6F8_FISSO|nr:hypothetical protein FisN_38Lh008 [Fistulifera solaris]|eukprot:GAX09587.1 hypothetical protein FisN_38Lh008 [Fistulifera solaris]